MDHPGRILTIVLLMALLELACGWQACTTYHLNVGLAGLVPLGPSTVTERPVCHGSG